MRIILLPNRFFTYPRIDNETLLLQGQLAFLRDRIATLELLYSSSQANLFRANRKLGVYLKYTRDNVISPSDQRLLTDLIDELLISDFDIIGQTHGIQQYVDLKNEERCGSFPQNGGQNLSISEFDESGFEKPDIENEREGGSAPSQNNEVASPAPISGKQLTLPSPQTRVPRLRSARLPIGGRRPNQRF